MVVYEILLPWPFPQTERLDEFEIVVRLATVRVIIITQNTLIKWRPVKCFLKSWWPALNNQVLKVVRSVSTASVVSLSRYIKQKTFFCLSAYLHISTFFTSVEFDTTLCYFWNLADDYRHPHSTNSFSGFAVGTNACFWSAGVDFGCLSRTAWNSILITVINERRTLKWFLYPLKTKNKLRR